MCDAAEPARHKCSLVEGNKGMQSKHATQETLHLYQNPLARSDARSRTHFVVKCLDPCQTRYPGLRQIKLAHTFTHVRRMYAVMPTTVPVATNSQTCLPFTWHPAVLQEYFFPKEDTTVKQRQQQWAKSVALRRKSAAGGNDPDKSSLHPTLNRSAMCPPYKQPPTHCVQPILSQNPNEVLAAM